jgi:hypothetical protein
VTEPQPGRKKALQAARNASSGFRRRLGVFLSTDAIRLIRAGGLAWVVTAAGFAAGVLLVITEFTHISYVTTITATCADFADPKLRDTCLTVGHESHHYGFAILGLFVILMTFGAAVGGSRPAAVAVLVSGALALGITLIHDLPRTDDKGEIGVAFAEGKAHKGSGFWFELVGGTLALACGAFLTWRTPPPRRERRPATAGGAEPGSGPEPEESPA